MFIEECSGWSRAAVNGWRRRARRRPDAEATIAGFIDRSRANIHTIDSRGV